MPKERIPIKPNEKESESEFRPEVIREAIEYLVFKQQSIPGTIRKALSPEAKPSPEFWAKGLREDVMGIKDNLTNRIINLIFRPI